MHVLGEAAFGRGDISAFFQMVGYMLVESVQNL